VGRSSSLFRRFGGTVFNTLLWCLAIGVLVQNVWLQREIAVLRTRQPAARPTIAKIDVGRRIIGVSGVSIDGKFKDISFSPNDPTNALVITFSGGCSVCQRNEKKWETLSSELKKQGWKIYWVSRDSWSLTKDYVDSTKLPSEYVVANPSHITYLQLALELVPRTFVVAPGGIVRQVWTGELKPDVFTYFNLPNPEAAESVGPVPATK
jgi:peroxiredoxin